MRIVFAAPVWRGLRHTGLCLFLLSCSPRLLFVEVLPSLEVLLLFILPLLILGRRRSTGLRWLLLAVLVDLLLLLLELLLVRVLLLGVLLLGVLLLPLLLLTRLL